MVDPISSIHNITFNISLLIDEIIIDKKNRKIIVRYKGSTDILINAVIRWLRNRGVKVVLKDGEKA